MFDVIIDFFVNLMYRYRKKDINLHDGSETVL